MTDVRSSTNGITKFPPVGKLVLLLSSDQPGEVVAAASAIDRSLRSAGYDWHDLAEAIEIGAAASRTTYRAEPVIEPLSEQDMARFAMGHLEDLTKNEANFIRSVMRLLAYGNGLSPKQSRWLMAIYLALGGRP